MRGDDGVERPDKKAGPILWTALAVVGLVSIGSSADRARAEDGSATEPGDTAWGLPGIVRIGVPTTGPRRVTLSGSAGYGYTEEIADEGGAHHRLLGSIGAGARPLEWLSVALRVDGRYDRHPPDELGDDDGWVGTPRLALRGGFQPSAAVALGAEVDLRIPGRDAPSLAFDAVVLESSLLATVRPIEALHVATRAGFRFDRSAESIDDPERLRQGDRTSLGVSDFHAIVVGVGASYRLGATELLGELTADVLLGNDAPSFGKMPIHATVGARHHVTRALQLELLLDVVPTARPAVRAGAPLVPVEPRTTATAGVRYRFGLEPATAPPTAPAVEPPQGPEPPQSGAEEPDPEPAVSGSVEDEAGKPIGGATVKLVVDGEVVEEARTDEQGRYELSARPSGTAEIVIEADGHQTTRLELPEDGSAPTRVQLQAVIPTGELRGLIRSYAGVGVGRATIHVTPGDIEVQTDGDGRFSVELEEGAYEVQIEAPGYRSQVRHLDVQENGVTVLNAELRRKRD